MSAGRQKLPEWTHEFARHQNRWRELQEERRLQEGYYAKQARESQAYQEKDDLESNFVLREDGLAYHGEMVVKVKEGTIAYSFLYKLFERSKVVKPPFFKKGRPVTIAQLKKMGFEDIHTKLKRLDAQIKKHPLVELEKITVPGFKAKQYQLLFHD